MLDHVARPLYFRVEAEGPSVQDGDARARTTPLVSCRTNILTHPHNGMSDVDVTLHVVPACA